MWSLGRTGELWKDLYVSLAELLLGFSLAVVIGIFVGFLMGTSPRIREYLEPLVSALYATPLVALIPFYILVFGIYLASKVALVFTVAVFPVIINTSAGYRESVRRRLSLLARRRLGHRSAAIHRTAHGALARILTKRMTKGADHISGPGPRLFQRGGA